MSWLRGIDVSSVQGKVDWQAVKDFGITFAIAKVSEAGYQDPAGIKNLEGANAVGILNGAYAFLRPSLGSPEAQAKKLWDSIGSQMTCLPPTLDLENAPDSMTPTQIVEFFLAAADAVESYFGRPPMCYSYPWFETGRVLPGISGANAARLARCPLWQADYSKGELPAEGSSPFIPKIWDSWTLWQTAGDKSSKVPGIAGAVDHDVFHGDIAALRAFCGLPA